MPQKIKFTKMHGLGNDFVIIKSEDLPLHCNLQELAINISNRFTGIGCDQFIIYGPIKANTTSSSYKMDIFNQDGSMAKLCGNAARCVAKLIFSQDSANAKIILEVDGLKQICKVVPRSNGNLEDLISVNVGLPSFKADWMIPSEKIKSSSPILQELLEGTKCICVDVGNPHFIIFGDIHDLAIQNIIGSTLQHIFKGGVNVSFAKIQNSAKISLNVYERGVGFTLACGSAACSTFAAGEKLGYVSGPSCEIIFKLGSLYLTRDIGNGSVEMKGPASLVAIGEYNYDVN